MTVSRQKEPGGVAFLALPVVLAFSIFAMGALQVGYLSDDFALIRAAERSGWFGAIEKTHFSPAISFLFKCASLSWISATQWHLLAFGFHCLNVGLFIRLVSRLLEPTRFLVVVVGCLFALCAPGIEALAWACALGYVLILTIILCGLLVMSSPRPRLSRDRWTLCLLQLLACLVWDWAVLFAPIITVAGCFGWGPGDRRLPILRRLLLLLGPTCAMLLSYMIFRGAMGYRLGEPVGLRPDKIIHLLLSAPLRCIFPNSSIEFYRSSLGNLLSMAVWGVMIVPCLHDRNARMLLVVFGLCQVPYIYFGTPESRYFYISSPFLFAVLARRPAKRSWCFLWKGMVVVAFALAVYCAVERAALWRAAYLQAQSIRNEVIEWIESRRARLCVIVNLPDAYGPANMLWKPYVWRNGFFVEGVKIRRINTTDADFIWRDSAIPILSRKEILETQTRGLILEVRADSEQGSQKFHVQEFNGIALPERRGAQSAGPPGAD
ncbi:MAG TPA: hypothetical protein VNT79_13545 [Phycisphaerae bacterium]|nr:hypothetical protein [Phycisphaerae bacterium]